MGYQLIIVSLGCLRASLKAVWDYVADLRDRNEEAEKDFEKKLRGHPTEDFNTLLGSQGLGRSSRNFCPLKRYKESIRNQRACIDGALRASS